MTSYFLKMIIESYIMTQMSYVDNSVDFGDFF